MTPTVNKTEDNGSRRYFLTSGEVGNEVFDKCFSQCLFLVPEAVEALFPGVTTSVYSVSKWNIQRDMRSNRGLNDLRKGMMQLVAWGFVICYG